MSNLARMPEWCNGAEELHKAYSFDLTNNTVFGR
jgi:hypothetical protein